MRFNTYELNKKGELLDEYGEVASLYSPSGTVRVSISLKENKILENNPLYLSATHIGITKANNIAVGDLLKGEKNFEVLSLIADGLRMNAWLLKEVENE